MAAIRIYLSGLTGFAQHKMGPSRSLAAYALCLLQDLAQKLSAAEQRQARASAADAGQCAHCAALQEALADMEAELAGTRAEHEQVCAQLERVCAGEHALKQENLGLAAAVEAAQERMAAPQADGEALQQENLDLCAAAAAHGCELAAAQEAAAQQLAEAQEAAAAQLAEALEVRCPCPKRLSNVMKLLMFSPYL